MMRTSVATVVIFLLWFLSAAIFNFSKCNADPKVVCNEKERRALLSFKQGLRDPMNSLSSWSVQEDCCEWKGVHCDNITGRVIQLYLRNAGLEGMIPPQLGNLSSLRYLSLGFNSLDGQIPSAILNLGNLNSLDLCGNQFTGQILEWLVQLKYLEQLCLGANSFHGPIPASLGNLSFLNYLNLGWNHFEGMIPTQLGNLSSLRFLRLGGKDDDLYVDNLSWISRLSSLEYLYMDGLDLHREVNWLQALSVLPSLSGLNLSNCQLGTMIPPLGYVNFTSLVGLDLSYNLFNGEIPNWLFNLSSSLSYLNLRGNQLTGQIPEWLGQLKYLKWLFLHNNSFHGPIPASLGNLSSLSQLSLHINQLNGSLPKSLGLLSNLEELYIGDNLLAGNVSEVNFAKLSKLNTLVMSSNSFFFNVNSNWVPPFQLEILYMRSCKMGPKFPEWLQTQRKLQLLDFLKSGISGTVPNWFWKLASRIQVINLSDNQIDGDISTVLLNSSFIHLSSNCFKGQLPRLSPTVIMLELADNSFSGPISPFLCQNMNEEYQLKVLDVSNNLLSGEISDCWMYWQSLVRINFGSNNLSGKIPNLIGSFVALQSLHLHNNSFFGDIPLSLQNCTSLGLIDSGENRLSGNIPNWMGQRKTLRILCLRSNKLSGNIPQQICQLASLLVLDFANNMLSGSIPECLNKMSAMATTDTRCDDYVEPFQYNDVDAPQLYAEDLVLVTKGRESEYKEILQLVRAIDLSNNNLSGSIPTEISSLIGLRFLNLSRNHLMGKIPEKIGGMKLLESVDLSRNHLLGEIPQSISYLTFLSVLNLSYNNFSGRIPSSTQLQSFDATSYAGNVELCGDPLTKNCTKAEESPGVTPVGETGEEFEMLWFYIGMGTGFPVSFWGFWGVLFFNRTWRHAYFRFLDDMKDKILEDTTLKVNWFRGKIKRYHVGQ